MNPRRMRTNSLKRDCYQNFKAEANSIWDTYQKEHTQKQIVSFKVKLNHTPKNSLYVIVNWPNWSDLLLWRGSYTIYLWWSALCSVTHDFRLEKLDVTFEGWRSRILNLVCVVFKSFDSLEKSELSLDEA